MFIILLFPLYFMFIGSLQDINGVMVMPPKLIPKNATFFNYHTMKAYPFFTWIYNSVIIVAMTVCFSVCLSLLTGYAFAYFTFKYKNIIWAMFLIGIMLPRISLIIPQYVILRKLGISGTQLGVILSTSFSPVGIYLARTFFETVPKSLLESARIDGAGELSILGKIVFPLSKPLVTALCLFSGIAAMQDYIWQMLVLQDQEKQTLLVGLIRSIILRNDGMIGVNPLGRSFAAGVILFIPLLIIFLVSNKYFVNALGGAIKE